jgi:RimJ/RimL family protein N-acetyltransferase
MRNRSHCKSGEVTLRELLPSDIDELARIFGTSPLLKVLETQLTHPQRTSIDHPYAGNVPIFKAWGVTLAEKSSPILGIVNYHHLDFLNRRTEIGYFMAEPYRRQGIMKCAVLDVLKYCFETLDLHRIEATIEPQNVAAIRLAESCGFRKESGLLRDRIYVEQTFRSVVMYGLIRKEES